MNRTLHYVNLVGVLVLGVLCSLQWRIDRQLNLRINQLEKERIGDRQRIEEQVQTIEGQTADLERFREHVARSTAGLKVAESNLMAARRECHQLAGERDQLKESVSSWSTAVAERDEQLTRASDQLQKLGQERYDIVARFNSLAEKHNVVVADLNKTTREFNALVERYNTLAKEKTSPR